MNNIFDDYDYEKEYDCSRITKCNHFSKLMFLIINVNNIPNGHTILKNYISTNQDEINKKNAEGWTALHIAARNSNIYGSEIVKLLLENNADVNLTDKIGFTALMLAAKYSNTESSLETVKLLLEKGANINLINKYGWTALMWAVQYSNSSSNLETVKLLLEKGANVNLTEKNGRTVLMMAARYSNRNGLETAKLLLENCANVNLIDKDNKTFFNYIPIECLQECLDIVYQIKYQKLFMKKLLKPINLRSIELLLRPDSLRIKLIGIKWNSNNNLFEELSTNDPSLLSYFGITDEESLKWKIIDNLKYVD